MEPLPLTPDELLTTTRAVRRRLDLDRPVDPGVVADCLRIALQAPSSSNHQQWRFVVVTEPATRAAIAEHYRRSFADYDQGPPDDEAGGVLRSARHLARRFADVPVMVIPCVTPRPDGTPPVSAASLYASILPATWSFMLAARARGLGTCLTTLHLPYERECAEILGIPFARVAQVALVTVAHTTGNPFVPARGRSLDGVVSWERWAGPTAEG